MDAERIAELRAYVKPGREGGWTLTSFEIADREMIAELLDEVERLTALTNKEQELFVHDIDVRMFLDKNGTISLSDFVCAMRILARKYPHD